jgi:hypothetical protein
VTGLSAEVRAAHAGLSECSVEFLEYALADPECLRRSSFAQLDRRDDFVQYPLQPWPTFVDAAALAGMERAGVELCRLIRAVPERIFGRDPERLGRYYGIGAPNSYLVAELLGNRTLMNGLLARGDFVQSAAGLQCLEFNIVGYLGGWQAEIWSRLCAEAPVVARFLRERSDRYDFTFRDVARDCLEHLVAGALRAGIAQGELNVAIAIPPHERRGQAVDEFARRKLAALLEQTPGVERGTAVLCDIPELEERGGCLYVGETRIHVLVEQFGGMIGRQAFHCLMRGTVNVHNGPVTPVLTDKRNLALLSEHQESDRFSAAERAILTAHLPWTREVVDRTVRDGGREVGLVDLIAARREDLVLKPARTAQGTGVLFGRSLSVLEWSDAIQKALSEPGAWVVQASVESLPYLYQSGESGCAPHDVVWGLFVFGDSLSGGFLRMLPKGSPGVINAARGATEGVIVEVASAPEID